MDKNKNAEKDDSNTSCYKVDENGRVDISDELRRCLSGHGIYVPPSGILFEYTTVFNNIENAVKKNKEFKSFVEFLRKEIASHELSLESRIASGIVDFGDLPLLLKNGTEVVYRDLEDGDLGGGKVDHVNLRCSIFGFYFQVKVSTISSSKGYARSAWMQVNIPQFSGAKNIRDFAIRPATPDDKAFLKERGKKFAEVTARPSYCQYGGQLLRKSWFGGSRMLAAGRVMVDAAAMKRVDADYFNDNYYDDEDRDDGENKSSIREDDLWMCEPRVFGFSFGLKKWGELRVADLSPVAFRKDAFEKLVMDEEKKRVVLALVERGGFGFKDVIDGKGGGTIFLLHGSPGLGKTMTAESVAEVLERPLYAVGAGELGVEPTALEKSLRSILDVAAHWNAVILFDEADVYLEQRDERDIVRNAMVGVFLRLLEYHSGVLFLTTNRVKNFDRAFFSRISLVLHYPDLDSGAREKVWRNLLQAAGIRDVETEDLAKLSLNGRQIKNAIRVAQALAGDSQVTTKSVYQAARMVAVDVGEGQDVRDDAVWAASKKNGERLARSEA